MYQGKFASKDKKGNAPQHTEQLPQNPQPVRRPTPQAPAQGYDSSRPMAQGRPQNYDPSRPMAQGRPQNYDPSRPMAQGRSQNYDSSRPVAQGRPQNYDSSRPVAQGRPQNYDPVQTGSRPVPQPVPEPYQMPQQQPVPQKKRHYGGLIFYILFFAGILAIYSFTYVKLGDLQDWLIRYESAQPTRKYEEVFELYFEHPNWGLLYDNAGITESAYEGKKAFVTYMEQKVGDTPLTGLETSAGLSKDTKKYIVRLGDEKLASFTLVDRNKAAQSTVNPDLPNIPNIPDWQLGEIDLFYERIGTYYIKTIQGQKVQVNGVPLDEMNTVRVSTTKANEYLSEGLSAPLTAVHQVDGLMVKPDITVTDADGKTVETTYDEESHTFTVPAAGAEEMDPDLKNRALSAIKTYAMYMSVKGGLENELAEYFQRGTDLFKTFTSMERTWNQRYADHSFSGDNVKDYVRYSDDLFSARVSTSLHLVRSDGSEKVTLLDQSMFFKKIDGTWKCTEMTAVDVNQPVEQVRLTFKNGTQVLKSEMVDASLTKVECPAVEIPAGKTFLGWVVEERKPNGDRVMRLTLEPDEENIAPAPLEGLKPMVLLPLFE